MPDTIENPSADWLATHAEKVMPQITRTEFGNLNYQARITARLSRSTHFVSDTEIYQNRISPEEASHWADVQDAYIESQQMIALEGYIGPAEDSRVGVRLLIEASNPNIAGMQKQLYFPRDSAWVQDLSVVYTPGLSAPGKPDDCLIIVDLDKRTTRILGSDYFGESKMGGLRMWNHHVYRHGGLGMHAGLKVFPGAGDDEADDKSMLIVGLSGTGKTTTTFGRHGASLPVQDDFVALMPDGRILTTENGCFAKTHGLTSEGEPSIYQGATRPDSWLENVSVDGKGQVDFFDKRHTANGRATFPLEAIPHHDPGDVPPPSYMLILNRNSNVIPAVAKLKPAQVPGYFMLGETTGTSAGGAAEEGRSLRVPGTNPFFFNDDSMQGNRLLDLLDRLQGPMEVYVLNTGRVGGVENDDRGKDIPIDLSAAVVEGIVNGNIDWELDPDFGYLTAAAIPGVDDRELLQPRYLYERQSRMTEYNDYVRDLWAERRTYLQAWPSLRPEVIAGL